MAEKHYFVFLDESDHTKKDSFTICGLTAIPIARCADLSRRVAEILNASPYFRKGEALKFNSGSKPKNCPEGHHPALFTQISGNGWCAPESRVESIC